MSEPAFDTLCASRRLKDAGVKAEQAEAIVEVMAQSTANLVTVERFEAGVASLHARIDSVNTRIDSVNTELRTRIDTRIEALEEKMTGAIARHTLLTVGIMISAVALMFTVFGFFLTYLGAFAAMPPGAG